MKHGKLAAQLCGARLPLTVLSSRAGFYIGTADAKGPVSRESEEYWRNYSAAETALNNGLWTQRSTP